ncbi:hypothetical protein AGMMS49579_09780 [Spirochaetia bacterium]|nr:hypothetical protein AGMMS49579_09780 [Spirochaetia bacterium]
MRNFFKILFFIMLIGYGPATAAAQHYKVIIADGNGNEGTLIAREMESRFEAYNKLFRFSSALLENPLKVQVFLNTDSYDEYVSARLGETRPGAVYIHYNQKEKRELVINRGSSDESKALPYQAFIQYLRAFVPNPPLWMREGFAIYFSTLNFSPEGEMSYEENLSWLGTVKALGSNAPPLEAILRADGGGTGPSGEEADVDPHLRSALSWAAASFFMDSGNGDYLRSLEESFMLLSDTATAAENTGKTANRIFRWSGAETMNRDFLSWLASRKTFAEFMEEGQRAYADKDPAAAELAFSRALDQKPGHYAPRYYLGLLAYENNNFDLAEQLYLSSREYGAEEALVSYALGINAAAAGRSKDAVDFLHRAAEAAPEKYKARAEDLISRLR